MQHTRPWKERFEQVTGRLREPLWWFPFPFALSFGLVLLLTAHVLFGTNPRLGNPANILLFPSEPSKDSALWMSVTPIADDIVVTTGKRDVFRWPQNIRSLDEIAPFVSYLKHRAASEIEAAALAGAASTTQTRAVIAADQRLKFFHMRPILYALAEAGIVQYAFETQNLTVASTSDEEAPGSMEH